VPAARQQAGQAHAPPPPLERGAQGARAVIVQTSEGRHRQRKTCVTATGARFLCFCILKRLVFQLGVFVHGKSCDAVPNLGHDATDALGRVVAGQAAKGAREQGPA
jgi:hypothetical protein